MPEILKHIITFGGYAIREYRKMIRDEARDKDDARRLALRRAIRSLNDKLDG